MSDNNQASPVEQEARSMGWVPQAEFRGDADRWVDADTFVERGRTVLPILKANNKKLEEQTQHQASEIARLKQLFEASQESISELQKVHNEHTKAAVEKARRDLLAELKVAKEEGDVEREVEITDRLTNMKAAEKAAAAQAPASNRPDPTAAGEEALHPDFKAWQSDNKWFGTDERKTMRAMGIAQELRADPDYDNLTGRAFYDKIVEIMEERTNGRPAASKVGGTRPTGQGGNSGSTSRGYADLPPEAKDACDKQGKKLVGEGRAFKDVNAWRKYYVDLYYQGEAR